MDKFLVLVGCVLVAGFIIWWFFGKHSKREAGATMVNDKQEVEVIVNGGYTPNTVVLKQGVPASIVFHRKDPSGCFSHVVFPDLGINEALSVDKQQAIDIDTSKATEYSYTCGMNMFYGKVIVR